MTRTNFAARLALSTFAISVLFSMTCISRLAVAAPESDHITDHAEHQHVMDHSGHEHHMSDKPGVFNSTIESYTVPDVKLVDMNGAEVALHDILNGSTPVIMNFIFTTCTTICPVMSTTFQQVQQQLGSKRSNVRMVSISIDPEHDTPVKLKEYARKYGVGSQWKMLTGTLENSIAVQRAFGVFAGDKMNHRPVTFLKAQGLENPWLRLDGLVNAPDIIAESDKLKTK